MRWEGTDVVVQWEPGEKKTHVVCSVSFRPVNHRRTPWSFSETVKQRVVSRHGPLHDVFASQGLQCCTQGEAHHDHRHLGRITALPRRPRSSMIHPSACESLLWCANRTRSWTGQTRWRVVQAGTRERRGNLKIFSLLRLAPSCLFSLPSSSTARAAQPSRRGAWRVLSANGDPPRTGEHHCAGLAAREMETPRGLGRGPGGGAAERSSLSGRRHNPKPPAGP
jgi:hypothetical protein